MASIPDTNEYAAFVQDTIRVTNHLALSLGARYDLQTFTRKGLVTNPLWPDSGKVPFDPYNFAPRVGFAYSIGNQKPAGGAGRIRLVLYPHSADLHLDHRHRQRILIGEPLSQQFQFLRSSGLSRNTRIPW